MTTLTNTPVGPLLERLFAEASSTPIPAMAAFAALLPAERARMMGSKTEYRELYAQLKEAAIPVSRATGALLYMLARSTQASAIVEFGTSFGISTLHLAAALRDNGGGRLITTEFEPSKAQRARANLDAGGLLDLVEIREGDALETLRADLPEWIDLLLLDGAKALYADVLRLVEQRLRPGALIVADNADYCPEYLALVRAPQSGYLSLPFGGDVELSMKCG
ncbi:methyltransferase [Massilia sp. Root351]|jgi:predicted O-methyltransferase YrrM|uniref:O-methyltransferase n=1 Tax=Massilia sp. Root351 TaxID=1736522 RepID=UPI000710D173|nr:class I SAM-dependent methyltransferase [Massilia sp. Root351]KQV90047.1 methyltransferase [Massilia sp. Root351]